MSTAWFEVRAGERARRHIEPRTSPARHRLHPRGRRRTEGSRPDAVRSPVARASGCPFTARMEFIGASIGAWRMTALAQTDPLAALDRLQHTYVREQNYAKRPSPSQVAAVCRGLARSVLDGRALDIRAGRSAVDIDGARTAGRLQSRGRGRRSRCAALANAEDGAGSQHTCGASSSERARRRTSVCHSMTSASSALTSRGNVEDAMLASGSIPSMCDPVRESWAHPSETTGMAG